MEFTQHAALILFHFAISTLKMLFKTNFAIDIFLVSTVHVFNDLSTIYSIAL